MGVAKELFELGFKKISKATMNFLETGVPRTDQAGIIRAATNSPQELTEYIRHADNFVKKKDQSGILPMIQYSDKWNNEAVDAARQADTLSLGTTPVAKQDALYKYEPFQVDETLPIEEQKRIYKQAASDFIYEAEQVEGKTVPVSKFFKEKGKLRVPEEGELDLKWKKKIDGKKDFQPKLKKTTAKETALRKSREKPWITKKSEIEKILKEAGQEDKLNQLIKLIRSQYNKKVKQIKASGLSKGHQKSLEKGGWDIPENIVGEQGVSTKEVRGNYARQYKEDLPDEELRKQGAFVGTLKEYILMKLKELE